MRHAPAPVVVAAPFVASAPVGLPGDTVAPPVPLVIPLPVADPLAGTVPVWWGEDDGPRILLCLRNIEPRKGFWTLPAGFLETGETTAEGAARETWEEAGARVEMEGLFSVLDVVRAGQVHLFYRARLLDLDYLEGNRECGARINRPDYICGPCRCVIRECA